MMKKWSPILLVELEQLIKLGVSKMSFNQIKLWGRISIVPEKWEEHEFGNYGGGFWVAAIVENRVIWYNDIEEGFNVSPFSEYGVIDEYGAEQDELQWVMNRL